MVKSSLSCIIYKWLSFVIDIGVGCIFLPSIIGFANTEQPVRERFYANRWRRYFFSVNELVCFNYLYNDYLCFCSICNAIDVTWTQAIKVLSFYRTSATKNLACILWVSILRSVNRYLAMKYLNCCLTNNDWDINLYSSNEWDINLYSRYIGSCRFLVVLYFRLPTSLQLLYLRNHKA